MPKDGNPEVTSFMRPAPHANESELGLQEDDIVADPIADSTIFLWTETARKNREIFTEIFRPVPTNLTRNWAAYDVRFHVLFVHFGTLIEGVRSELCPES